jgi:hypothetical protein
VYQGTSTCMLMSVMPSSGSTGPSRKEGPPVLKAFSVSFHLSPHLFSGHSPAEHHALDECMSITGFHHVLSLWGQRRRRGEHAANDHW